MSTYNDQLIRLDYAIEAIKKNCKYKTSSHIDIKLLLSNLLDTLNNDEKSSLTKELEIQINDKKKVESRLDGFNPNESLAWIEICKKYGSSLSHNELISIAQVFASNFGIKVDRDAKRRKEVLIKWFDENSKLLIPFLNYIRIEKAENEESS